MADKSLPEQVDVLIWSLLAELPIIERLWEAGDKPVELEPEELYMLLRLVSRGFRDAILLLAEEVEQLKACQ